MTADELIDLLYAAVTVDVPPRAELHLEFYDVSNFDTSSGRYYLPAVEAHLHNGQRSASKEAYTEEDVIDADLLRRHARDIARLLFGSDDPLAVANQLLSLPSPSVLAAQRETVSE